MTETRSVQAVQADVDEQTRSESGSSPAWVQFPPDDPRRIKLHESCGTEASKQWAISLVFMIAGIGCVIAFAIWVALGFSRGAPSLLNVIFAPWPLTFAVAAGGLFVWTHKQEKVARAAMVEACLVDQTTNYLAMPAKALQLGDRIGSMQVVQAEKDYLHLAPPRERWYFMLRDTLVTLAGVLMVAGAVALIATGVINGKKIFLTIKIGALIGTVGGGCVYAGLGRKPYQLIASRGARGVGGSGGSVVAQSISLLGGIKTVDVTAVDNITFEYREGVLSVTDAVMSSSRNQHAFSKIRAEDAKAGGVQLPLVAFGAGPRSWGEVKGVVHALWSAAGLGPTTRLRVYSAAPGRTETTVRTWVHANRERNINTPGYDERGMPIYYFEKQPMDIAVKDVIL
jgi:hypothetical protein